MRFRQLLVVDEPPGGEQVLSGAAALAEASGGRVRLVGAVHPRARGTAAAREEVLRRLEGRAAALRGRGLHVTTAVLRGDGADEILLEAARAGSELVVKRRARAGSLGALVRGRADRLLVRRASCPVWLVDEEISADGPVLAALAGDGEDPPAAALDVQVLEAAAALAAALRTALHLVHAWSVPLMPTLCRVEVDPRRNRRAIEEGAAAAAARVERCLATAGPTLPAGRVHVVRADPRAALPELAERTRAQVLVLGEVSRGGVAAAIRGVAVRVLRALPCSLLVVRGDGVPAPARPRAVASARVLRPADR